MPAAIKKYCALTKPERTLTNVLSAAAGFLFAAAWHIDWSSLAALLIGSTLIIASACVFNNYIDRDLDRKMSRTKRRALVTGDISVRRAILFAAVLGVAGFWILAYTNWLTFGVGVVAFVGYVVLYDLAKRYSEYGTLVGTIPGGASLVAGYTAVVDRLDTAAVLLFVIMAAWQMAHFYAIAIYRLQDYKAAGVPVWPAKHGVQSTKRQMLFYIAIFVIAGVLLSWFGYCGVIYLVVMTLLGAYWWWRGWRGLTAAGSTAWARSMFGLSLVVLLAFFVLLTVGPSLP